MEPVIELHHWNAYQFGRFEYRLAGYVIGESFQRCVVSEPIVSVNSELGQVNTADGKVYQPLDIMDPSQKMDMMYVLGKWIEINMKNQPREATNMIAEELKGKKNEG